MTNMDDRCVEKGQAVFEIKLPAQYSRTLDKGHACLENNFLRNVDGASNRFGYGGSCQDELKRWIFNCEGVQCCCCAICAACVETTGEGLEAWTAVPFGGNGENGDL